MNGRNLFPHAPTPSASRTPPHHPQGGSVASVPGSGADDLCQMMGSSLNLSDNKDKLPVFKFNFMDDHLNMFLLVVLTQLLTGTVKCDGRVLSGGRTMLVEWSKSDVLTNPRCFRDLMTLVHTRGNHAMQKNGGRMLSAFTRMVEGGSGRRTASHQLPSCPSFLLLLLLSHPRCTPPSSRHQLNKDAQIGFQAKETPARNVPFSNETTFCESGASSHW
jgi:hypothetical protein